jgi:hypothetical protein
MLAVGDRDYQVGDREAVAARVISVTVRAAMGRLRGRFA